MQIRLRLSPSQNGSKAPTKQHAARLVCARCEYAQSSPRRKTVELTEEPEAWHPKDSRERQHMRPTANRRVPAGIGFSENSYAAELNRSATVGYESSALGRYLTVKQQRWARRIGFWAGGY